MTFKQRINAFMNETTDVGKFLAAVIFVTIISQAPIVQNFSGYRYLSYAAWGLYIVYLVFKMRSFDFVIPWGYLVFAAVYLLYIIFATVFSGTSYFNVTGFSPFWISLVLFFVNIITGKYVTENDMRMLSFVYVWTTVIYTANIYLSYLTNVNFASLDYEYTQKNAAAMIILVGVLFAVMCEMKHSKTLGKIVYVLVSLFMVYAIILLRSRAVIVCLVSCMIVILLFGKGNLPARLIVIGLLIAALVLLSNENYYDVFVNQIMLNNRDAEDTWAVTAGRSEEWENFGTLLEENFFFGRGHYKQESFYLACMLELGFFMGIAMIIYAASPIFFMVRRLNLRNNDFALAFLVIGVGFLVNAVFEGQTPLGPGVKCCMYWTLYGIFYGLQTRTDEFSKKCILRIGRGLNDPHAVR